MANFTMTTPAEPRFDEELKIEPDANYQASPEEEACLEAIRAVIELLAAEKVADTKENYPTELRASRDRTRKAIAEKLKRDVQRFIEGKLTAQETTQRAEGLQAEYHENVCKFGSKDATAPRFERDFQLVSVAGYTPSAVESAYLKRLSATLDELAADEASDPMAGYSDLVLTTRRARRNEAAARLRAESERFCAREVSADVAGEEVLVAKGMYRAQRDRLTRRLFNVTVVKDQNYSVDLDIRLVNGLPAPEDAVTPGKQDLFVQINKTATVIRTVCHRMLERAGGGCRASPRKTERASRLLSEYIDKLYGIACIGLESPHTALASLALAELRMEFVAQEAGRIKNQYMRSLGMWAGVATILFLAAYAFVAGCDPTASWWGKHRSFLLAAAGAAIGTWVSFSARQVQFSFDDLLMLEEDSLDPPLRIIFVVAITATACLLFWTGSMNLEIGDLKTEPDSFGKKGSVALLVGIFAGLSERALATAISGRATAFVKSLAAGG